MSESQDHLQSPETEPSPPWTCVADFYILPFHVPSSSVSSIPQSLLHDPLEASHEASSTAFSQHKGGFGSIHIVRYKESPVGPYDELVISPGSYTWARQDGGKRVEGKGLRITRIYVSQRETCHYGRKYWNIPKHLADFAFTTNSDGSTTLTLRPFESPPSTPPLFTTNFRPTPYLPSFPCSLSAVSPFISLNIVNPPLPSLFAAGEEETEDAKMLCGTDRWCSFTPKIASWKSSLGWFDMRQAVQDGSDNDNRSGETEAAKETNFWPGWGRWRIGVYMKDAKAIFDQPKTWPQDDAREVNQS
ncbi:hypothetical protein LIA77_08840 [Sarocladium implicatum]|nr:hypothetical protein LIA77_08840 [Sarocladium implicatum]